MQRTENPDVAPPRAGRREWIGLGAIALACMLYVMDLTVLHLAIPAISADLQPSSTQLLWIIDIYGFVVAGSLITMGTLGDRIGRRRLLLIGAAAFGARLGARRAFDERRDADRHQGAAGGRRRDDRAVDAVADPEHVPRPAPADEAIAVWITSFSVGGAIGPLLGGLVLEFFWWGAAFLVSVPVMAAPAGPRAEAPARVQDPERRGLDMPSAALSLLAVLAVIFGLKQFAQDGIGWLPMASRWRSGS